MRNQAGFVVLAMAGLWIAYLVPHRLRFRQQLLESRTDDRFSERLRVLRVATTAEQGTHVARQMAARPGQVQLHPSREGARRGDGSMDRPHATRDRISADAARRTAAEHAQRAAHLARRRAAARRRAVLTAALLVAVAGGWTAVGTIGAGLALGATPSVLLVAVLGLGRRAVLAGARADAAWAAVAEHRVPLAGSSDRTSTGGRTPSVTGRAVHPSDATTEVMARVPAAGTEREAAPSTGAGDGSSVTGSTASVRGAVTADAVVPEDSTWAPVPVPRPAYTLKPAARRAEPAPLVLDEWSPSASNAAAAAAGAAGDEETGDEFRSDGRGTTPSTGGLSLDAILARRRAAGE